LESTVVSSAAQQDAARRYVQNGVDAVLKLKEVSAAAWGSRVAVLTNSLTTLEEPFRASLCTLDGSLLDDLEGSLLDDLDLEDVFG
jgi:hypothetical protein